MRALFFSFSGEQEDPYRVAMSEEKVSLGKVLILHSCIIIIIAIIIEVEKTSKML